MFGWFKTNVRRVDLSKSDKIIIAQDRLDDFKKEAVKNVPVYAARNGDSPFFLISRNAEHHINRMEEINNKISQIYKNKNKATLELGELDLDTEPFSQRYAEIQRYNEELGALDREFNFLYPELLDIGFTANAGHPLFRNLQQQPYVDNTWGGFFERVFRRPWRYEDRPEEEYESMGEDGEDAQVSPPQGFFDEIRATLFTRRGRGQVQEEEEPLLSEGDIGEAAQHNYGSTLDQEEEGTAQHQQAVRSPLHHTTNLVIQMGLQQQNITFMGEAGAPPLEEFLGGQPPIAGGIGGFFGEASHH
jgi:hypothetical protein